MLSSMCAAPSSSMEASLREEEQWGIQREARRGRTPAFSTPCSNKAVRGRKAGMGVDAGGWVHRAPPARLEQPHHLALAQPAQVALERAGEQL